MTDNKRGPFYTRPDPALAQLNSSWPGGKIYPMEDNNKPGRYTDDKGRDLIDDWSDRKTPEEMRAALIFNIEKYTRRYGKKDTHVNEAEKIAVYAQRLLDYERGLVKD